ncbi:MAG: YfaZ family outer membrane protein [Panacagrimonas sp.]
MMSSAVRGAAAALLFAGACTVAQAETFDANVSGESIRVAIDGPLSRLFSDVDGAYDVGGIWGDDENDDDFIAGHAGLMVTGDAGAPAEKAKVTAGVGARFQYIGGEDDKGGALEFGGRAEVRVPQLERLGLSGYAWYGPEAASFGDIDDVFEYGLALDYQILRDAAIYVGYRKLSADVGRGPELEEKGVNGGIRLRF